jgi:hypothetical protein
MSIGAMMIDAGVMLTCVAILYAIGVLTGVLR